MALSASIPTGWKSKLLVALQKNAHLPYARYMQLATVKPNGHPANRTVVFRGFHNESDDVTFITDRRSRKVEDVSSNPAAEICWYFPDTREQFRLSGQMTIVGEDHPNADLLQARRLCWNKQSEASRKQFGWPQPGLPRLAENGDAADAGPVKDDAPLSDFCYVIVKVDEVDHVDLFGNTRTMFKRKGGGPDVGSAGAWEEMAVNP